MTRVLFGFLFVALGSPLQAALQDCEACRRYAGRARERPAKRLAEEAARP